MSGFPNRPIRDTFGPEIEDTFPVTNPKREIGEGTFNLAWWQSAGSGLVVPRAVLKVDVVAATSATTLAQMLAWDPNQNLPLLTWAYVSTGNYDITFASQYADQTGTLRTLILSFGTAFVIDTADEDDHRARCIVTGPNTATVRVFDATSLNTPIDRDFAVALW